MTNEQENSLVETIEVEATGQADPTEPAPPFSPPNETPPPEGGGSGDTGIITAVIGDNGEPVSATSATTTTSVPTQGLSGGVTRGGEGIITAIIGDNGEPVSATSTTTTSSVPS